MRRLLFCGHQPPQRIRLEQDLEGSHGIASEFGDSGPAGADGGLWQLQFESNLGFGCRGIVSRFSEAEPKRQGRAMTSGQRSLAQLTEHSQRGLHSPQVFEVEQVDYQRQVAHEPSTRLVEINVDAHVLQARVEMEEEVGAARRLSVPPTLELMAGGLLQPGQQPPGCQDSFLHRVDERLKRKNGFCGQIRHSWLTPFRRVA